LGHDPSRARRPCYVPSWFNVEMISTQSRGERGEDKARTRVLSVMPSTSASICAICGWPS
ncbi:MAG: hypothetical protein R6V12_14515, partial [Candidatus Hydrogenedentota bacterium]